MVLFFCPTGGWKMATIAEFLFIRLSHDSGFSPFADKWKNVSFFATGVMRSRRVAGVWILLAFCGNLTQLFAALQAGSALVQFGR
ncbi:hypothetical protein [Paraburkholderia xenovorans]